MDSEALINERTTLRQWLTRKYHQAQSNLLEENESTKELVIQKIQRMFQIDDELDGNGFVQEDIDRYGATCTFLTKYFNNVDNVVTNVNRVVAANDFKKRELPKFDGDIMKFRFFMQDFEELISCYPNMSGHEKLSRLKSFLVGNPHDLIECIEGTEEGYNQAIELLKKEYASTIRIKAEIRKMLQKLPKVNKNDLQSVNLAFMKMRKIFHFAHQTKMDDEFINYYMKKEMAKCWFGEIQRLFSSTASCEDMLKIFEEDFNGLRELDIGRTTSNSATNLYHVNRSSTNFICLICNGGHKTIYCNANLTNSEKERIARNKRLCFRCLRPNHTTNECQSRYICRICSQPHSAVICNKQRGSVSQGQPIDQQQPQSTINALSRAPQVNLICKDEMSNEQEKMSDKDKFELEDGLRIRRGKGMKKIVVPETLRRKILSEAHERFGHPGTKKMIRLISPTYYWRNIITDISNYVKHCEICQKNKRTKLKKFAVLEQLPPAEQPFDLVSIDTILGFGKYGSRKNMIHLVVDNCTRYAWAFPHTSTSKEAYVGVVQQMLKVGPIKQILTDKGTAFRSAHYRHFLEKHGIKRLTTSTANPQCNGCNERTNQELVKRIRCKINDPKTINKNWTKIAEDVIHEYNNTPHESTGFSPAFLLYGVLPYEQFRMDQDITIDEARRIAFQRSNESHTKNKIYYDQKFQRPCFQIGDKVVVQVAWHPNNGKLTPVMEGPYTILRKLSDVNYEINRRNQPEGRETEIIHSNKLRLFHSPDDFRLEAGRCDDLNRHDIDEGSLGLEFMEINESAR
ncbi:hypothetical protein BLA29_000942, partial [Euroglyphus maynei]